jgi:hypothetical protein
MCTALHSNAASHINKRMKSTKGIATARITNGTHKTMTVMPSRSPIAFATARKGPGASEDGCVIVVGGGTAIGG